MPNTNKSVAERFQAIIEHYNLSTPAFSKDLGFERADKIYNIVNGKFNPSYDILLAITNKFVDVNIDWLISGEGSMLKDTPVAEDIPILKDTTRDMSIYRLKTDYFDTGVQDIPLYEIDAAAGLTTLFNNQVQQIPIDYIKVPNAPVCDGAVFVRGDSMYPVLKSGDIACYKSVINIDNIYHGKIYLLDIDIEGDRILTFKYVQKSDLGDDYICLVSQNDHHADKDVHVKYIKALALVKISIRYHEIL